MYLRFLVVVLFSSLLMAQPPQASTPDSSTNKDSAAPSQNSSHEASGQKIPEGQGKPGARVDDDHMPKASGVLGDKSKLPPDAPVITIEGLCDQPIGTAAKVASSNCRTVITREQFEKLTDALNPNMPPSTRRQFATAYPRLLLFSKKAKEMGLDKEPRYQEMLQSASVQALANTLTLQMKQKAGDISDADVEKYYNDNPAKFQQYELQRIVVPKNKQHPVAGTANTLAKENPADEAAMKAEAEQVQAKAAAGGDIIALQKEAFDVAGLKSAAPKVSLGKLTLGKLPQDLQKAFDLKPGQVSELFSHPDGFYVYKLVSEQMIPLTEAKTQIHSTLQSDRMQASMELLLGSVDPELNPACFGSPAPDRPSPDQAPQASPQGGAKKEAAQESPATAPK